MLLRALTTEPAGADEDVGSAGGGPSRLQRCTIERALGGPGLQPGRRASGEKNNFLSFVARQVMMAPGEDGSGHLSEPQTQEVKKFYLLTSVRCLHLQAGCAGSNRLAASHLKNVEHWFEKLLRDFFISRTDNAL